MPWKKYERIAVEKASSATWEVRSCYTVEDWDYLIFKWSLPAPCSSVKLPREWSQVSFHISSSTVRLVNHKGLGLLCSSVVCWAAVGNWSSCLQVAAPYYCYRPMVRVDGLLIWTKPDEARLDLFVPLRTNLCLAKMTSTVMTQLSLARVFVQQQTW